MFKIMEKLKRNYRAKNYMKKEIQFGESFKT